MYTYIHTHKHTGIQAPMTDIDADTHRYECLQTFNLTNALWALQTLLTI